MSKVFQGKIAFVTGAASGIGRATAVAFHNEGARLILLDRNLDGISQTKDLIGANDSIIITADLEDIAATERAARSAIATAGQVDYLANVAGWSKSPGDSQAAEDKVLKMDPARWIKALTINLVAPALLTRLAAEDMIRRGAAGRIVNVSSSSAFRALSVPAAYAASKAGMMALTRASAAELGLYNINVNAVVPGLTLTPMARFQEPEDVAKAVSSGPAANLLRRASLPEDVASTIIYLCREESRQITGQGIHTSAGAVV